MPKRVVPPPEAKTVVVTVRTGMLEWQFYSEPVDPLWAQYLLDWLADTANLEVSRSAVIPARDVYGGEE